MGGNKDVDSDGDKEGKDGDADDKSGDEDDEEWWRQRMRKNDVISL